MPDRRFLDRLHDDPARVEPDLLPDALKPGYADLLDACAEARSGTVAPGAAARIRRRLETAPARERVVKLAWIVTVAATAALVLFAVGLFAPDAEQPAPSLADEKEDLTLPGAARLDQDTFVVRLTRDRRILVGPEKRAVSLEGLAAWIDGRNRLEAVDGRELSQLTAVVRADTGAPWQHLQWLMTVLAEERVYKVRFATRERLVPADLPRDLGLGPPRNEIKVQVTVRPGGKFAFGDRETNEPEAVSEWIAQAQRAAAGTPNTSVVGEIKAAHETPYADVVALLQRFRAAGLEDVQFYGTKLPTAEVRAAKTLPPVTSSWGGQKRPFRRDDLQRMHAEVRDVVKRDLGGALEGIGPGRVLIVDCDFDHPQLLFDLYGVPYRLVRRADLLTGTFPDARLLVVGCTRAPPAPEKDKLVRFVKDFVERGGWLLTSDWAAAHYTMKAFPERLRKAGGGRMQPDTTVPVGRRGRSPLLEGVFASNAEALWWLEETSTLVEPGRDVEVLLGSQVLRKRYGSDVIACVFEVGKGRVLHLVGHVYGRDGNREGLHAAHRLVLNFVAARFPRR